MEHYSNNQQPARGLRLLNSRHLWLFACVAFLAAPIPALADDACRAAFANGLQTFGDRGSIDFKRDAQLHEASFSQLATTNVKTSKQSTQLSCGPVHCLASGESVNKLDAGTFKKSSSPDIVNVPEMMTKTLQEEGSPEYKEIYVSTGAALTLASQPSPYLIKKLELGDNTTLTLSSGEYWIEKLILGANSHIKITGTDTVRLYVEKPLSVPESSTLNKNIQKAENFIIFHYHNIIFHEASETYALVYGGGDIQLKKQALLYGGISANNISLAQDSHVTYQSDAVAIANFGEICGNPTPLPDYVPPELHVDQAVPQIEAASITITGTAVDPVQAYSGIASVVAKTALGTAQEESTAAVLNSDSFSVDVPLRLGNNAITIEARDHSDNLTTSELSVKRISLPRFANITPADGSELTTPSITIAGEVHTDWPVTAVRFSYNDSSITLTESSAGIHTFSLPNIPLQIGDNSFALYVQNIDGTDKRDLTINYMPENPESIPAPELAILSPIDGTLLRDSTFRLKGHVVSHAGHAVVTINGQPVAAAPSNGQDYYFEDIVSFPAGQESYDVVIEATDALGKQTQLIAEYFYDGVAPQILVSGDLEPSPIVNPILLSPFTVGGMVIDKNLTSITVNDQPLPLQPGSEAGHYEFSLPLDLMPGAEKQLLFNAYDRSGNRTSIEYLFESTAQASINPLVPAESAEFVSSGEPVTTQVAARVSELPDGASVEVSMGSEKATLTVAGTLASGDITLPLQGGNYTLTYKVLDINQQLMASASRAIRINDEQAVDFVLSHHQPENGARNIEPNQPIELYFNKAIDMSKLSVAVRETLHGNTYMNADISGADFLSAQGYQLQAVHRDNELVPGAASILPGERSIAFYGARHYGFNADVYVDVNYDGEELGRFNFKVRPLPTFIIGGVADQFGQPLPGVTVSLPELNRTTTTNNDGSFAFGFQEQPGNEIPGGRYTLVINPGFSLPGYGTQVRTINLQGGRKNEIKVSRLPELHPDIPFQLISSGQQTASLASDELRINLTDARLLFDNGRTSGNVQVQFVPFEQVNAAMTPGVWPQWMFASQPRGIAVEGKVALDLKMPALNGGYNYIPPDTEYVVLLAYEREREVIKPVGIGQIENHRVLSVGKVNIETLDYLGYALVDPAQQTQLQEVAEGSKTLQQLLSVLQQ